MIKNTTINTTKNLMTVAALAGTVAFSTTHADERRFGYVYEPEVLPKGGMEFEQWVTLRTQRTGGAQVNQSNFNLFELREELEYGVTDRYSVSLYINGKNTSFQDTSVAPARNNSKFDFDGVSIENRYMLLNPADHAIGLTFYLEPRFSGDEAELEQKIIIGQRHGDWKWALNLTHAVEWTDNLHSTEGEVEASFGISRDISKHWSVGIEVRDHNELPEYKEWENTAVYVGPVVNYRQEKWWATLSVMPQVFGRNYKGDPDGHRNLELEGHERYNIRLLVGLSF